MTDSDRWGGFSGEHELGPPPHDEGGILWLELALLLALGAAVVLCVWGTSP